MSDGGGLDARSLQDMRQRAKKCSELAMTCDEQDLSADVLVLLDERERLRMGLEIARTAVNAAWAIDPTSVGFATAMHAIDAALARPVGRASLDSPEAQQ